MKFLNLVNLQDYVDYSYILSKYIKLDYKTTNLNKAVKSHGEYINQQMLKNTITIIFCVILMFCEYSIVTSIITFLNDKIQHKDREKAIGAIKVIPLIPNITVITVIIIIVFTKYFCHTKEKYLLEFKVEEFINCIENSILLIINKSKCIAFNHSIGKFEEIVNELNRLLTDFQLTISNEKYIKKNNSPVSTDTDLNIGIISCINIKIKALIELKNEIVSKIRISALNNHEKTINSNVISAWKASKNSEKNLSNCINLLIDFKEYVNKIAEEGVNKNKSETTNNKYNTKESFINDFTREIKTMSGKLNQIKELKTKEIGKETERDEIKILLQVNDILTHLGIKLKKRLDNLIVKTEKDNSNCKEKDPNNLASFTPEPVANLDILGLAIDFNDIQKKALNEITIKDTRENFAKSIAKEEVLSENYKITKLKCKEISLMDIMNGEREFSSQKDNLIYELNNKLNDIARISKQNDTNESSKQCILEQNKILDTINY